MLGPERAVDPERRGKVRLAPEQLDRSGQRRASPDVGRAAAHHFDALDRRSRHASPVDPPPEGIVQRHTVLEHDRAARARRSQSAERDSLRGRVGGAAARPAKERESRDRAEGVVHGGRRRGLQVVVGQDDRARSSVGEARRRARRRHDYLLGDRRRLQHDPRFGIEVGGRQAALGPAKSFFFGGEDRARGSRDSEASARVRHGALWRYRGNDRDDGAGHGRTGGVFDHSANGLGGGCGGYSEQQNGAFERPPARPPHGVTATPQGPSPAATVATTRFVLVSITETSLERPFAA